MKKRLGYVTWLSLLLCWEKKKYKKKKTKKQSLPTIKLSLTLTAFLSTLLFLHFKSIFITFFLPTMQIIFNHE